MVAVVMGATADAARGQDGMPTRSGRSDDRGVDWAEGFLPPTWSVRAVSGADAPRTSVTMVNGSPTIYLEADSAAGQVWRKLDRPVAPTPGNLEWSWRVDSSPGQSVLGDPDLDDAPARVFVVFGGGGLFGRPRVLFYTWGRTEAVGNSFVSYVNDRAAVIVLRNQGDPLGAWFDERRDPFEDFRAVFGREPDEIRAVGLMADTEQTGGHALAYLRSLTWRPGDTDTGAWKPDGSGPRETGDPHTENPNTR